MILKRSSTKHEYADFAFCTVNTNFSSRSGYKSANAVLRKILSEFQSLHCNTIDQDHVSVNVQDKRSL